MIPVALAVYPICACLNLISLFGKVRPHAMHLILPLSPESPPLLWLLTKCPRHPGSQLDETHMRNLVGWVLTNLLGHIANSSLTLFRIPGSKLSIVLRIQNSQFSNFYLTFLNCMYVFNEDAAEKQRVESKEIKQRSPMRVHIFYMLLS